ncbi:MAG: hypothetical protein Q8O46_00005 [bacterium]|nr:hypothetical protein [bacterium]
MSDSEPKPTKPTPELAAGFTTTSHFTVDQQGQLIPYLRGLQLDAEEIRGRHVVPSLTKKNGFVMQVISNQFHETPDMVGTLRTNCMDVRKIPAYISQHEALIKEKVINLFTRYLIDIQHPAGCLEKLIADDYSITYSVASLTSDGMAMAIDKKGAPISYCHFPGLVRMIPVHFNEQGQVLDQAIFINCLISLAETH